MFFASDKCPLCWSWTLLALETVHFALEINTLVLETNVRSKFSHTHTHTQLATSNFQTELKSSSPLKTGAILLQRPKRYLEAQWLLQLHYIDLEGQVNRENYTWTSAYSQLVATKLVTACTHAFSSPGVAWLYVPCLEYVKRSPRSQRLSMQSAFGDSFEALACQS